MAEVCAKGIGGDRGAEKGQGSPQNEGYKKQKAPTTHILTGSPRIPENLKPVPSTQHS